MLQKETNKRNLKPKASSPKKNQLTPNKRQTKQIEKISTKSNKKSEKKPDLAKKHQVLLASGKQSSKKQKTTSCKKSAGKVKTITDE